tara:strand:+ start:85 stop:261 length:177 start_codon:yes stop_codon:yes gene_type:complete
MEIQQIYLRDPKAAFKNAKEKGFDVKNTHMYMYTKYGQGKPYDVFKNIETRHLETVTV